MSEPVRLLLDAGNSAVKWRLDCVADGQPLAAGRAANSGALTELAEQLADVLVDGLAAASGGWRVVDVLACSVAGAALRESLTALCQQQFAVAVKFARVVDGAAGLQCGYTEPQRLGVDRWLAMLAARARYSGPLVVVDAGSAATFDLIEGDRHRGGFILPGLRLMRSALAAGTDAVKVPLAAVPAGQLGRSTAEAVNGGALAALRALALQLADDHRARLVVGGGDAALLCGELPAALSYPDMVLDGLVLAAD